MLDFLQNLLFAFIPLFVAMDVIGALPIYLGLTAKMTEGGKKRIVKQATLVAAVIGLAFLFTGKGIFALLGVTVADFKVAGGILLLVLSILDIIKSREERRVTGAEIGIVPLGMPLIIGPAALAALLAAGNSYGIIQTIIAFGINLTIVFLGLRFADAVSKIIGRATSIAISKIMYMLLAAIAVMMIREGLVVIMPGLLGK
jgi:multiple antibiotic resistance protein